MSEGKDQALMFLDCGRWHLRKPLPLWMTQSGAGYTVGDHVVGLCGTGKTLRDALADYSRNLVEFSDRISRQYQRLMEIMAVSVQKGTLDVTDCTLIHGLY